MYSLSVYLQKLREIYQLYFTIRNLSTPNPEPVSSRSYVVYVTTDNTSLCDIANNSEIVALINDIIMY